MNLISKNQVNTKLTIREITLIGIFSSLTVIGAFISIPIGPVPISMQTFFVLLSGIILGSKKAMLSQIVYVLLGLIGLPIFAGFTGGLQTVFKPSFGFIISFIVSSYLVGKIVEQNHKSLKNIVIAVIIGSLKMYAIRLPCMYCILNIMLAKNFDIFKIMEIGMFMFIPGDTIKGIVAVLIGKKLQGKLKIQI